MKILSYKRNTCSAYDKLKGQILGVFPQKPGKAGLVVSYRRFAAGLMRPELVFKCRPYTDQNAYMG